jgi:hypothetical protein
MRATRATLGSLTGRVAWVGHKLYMDSFFSFPDLFNDPRTMGYQLL